MERDMSISKPGIVGSLSAASSDSPKPYPPRMALSAASSESSNRNPNPNPNPNPGIPDALSSSDIQSRRQSDPSNPKPMTKRGRGRSEEADQMEPKTKKSSSTIPKGLEHIPDMVIRPVRPFPMPPLKEGTTYLCHFPKDPNYEYFPKVRVPPPHLIPRPPNPPPPPPVPTNIKCHICGGGDHRAPCCSYLAEIPRNQDILEDSGFQIVCECSWPILKGVCSSGFCSINRKRKVVPNYTLLFDPSGPDPIMESCGATRRLIPTNQIQ